jgi:hypothetical protein
VVWVKCRALEKRAREIETRREARVFDSWEKLSGEIPAWRKVEAQLVKVPVPVGRKVGYNTHAIFIHPFNIRTFTIQAHGKTPSSKRTAPNRQQRRERERESLERGGYG